MSVTMNDVKGIGPATAELLAEHNIISVADLAGCKIGQIAAIKGFSEIRAKRVIDAAKALLKTEPAAAPATHAAEMKKSSKKEKNRTEKPKKLKDKKKNKKKSKSEKDSKKADKAKSKDKKEKEAKKKKDKPRDKKKKK